MTASAPLLRIEGLDVDVAGESGVTHAVKRLQLAVAQGETFALVGESGSGKSMTALALLRLLPDAGRIVGGQIELGGTDLNDLSERAMRGVRGGRIGIIFQEPATSLNPVMRVGDQIVETLAAHTPLRGAAARERAIDWLRRVGIPEPERRIDDYPFQFSGGQKQRLMIAIALAAEPKLLIADEPTTALDVTVQAQVLELLAGIQREMGMAVLLITHDLAVVRNVAHHVALMRGGEIVESADARTFFERPRHPYARELFEAIPTFAKRGRPLSAQGRAADQGKAAPEAGAVVLDVQDLLVHYPVRKGVLRRVAAWVEAVNGVTFTLRAGETLALLGESGCGKTTTGKALLRLVEGARVQGRAMLDGHDLLGASRRELRRLRQDIQIVFPGSLRVARPAHAGRRYPRRGHCLAAPRTGRFGAQGAGRGPAGAGGAAGRHAHALSARILGRPAPAHRHRAGAGGRTEGADLRRTHFGAGRVGAGADPRSAARPPGRAGHRPTCSSRTTSAWSNTWPTASRSCTADASSRWGRRYRAARAAPRDDAAPAGRRAAAAVRGGERVGGDAVPVPVGTGTVPTVNR
ncbi:ABC transporter ATP-binding protein [Bordetella pertussis]|nr:ABC transporter ATP-binding protein [Bordetella pertussis]